MMQAAKAENLYEFIDLTKIRTAMYIGDASLSTLAANISGYTMACYLKGIDERLEPDFGLFHDFFANYYLRGESTAGWKNIILAENFGNEEQALEVFYKLFDAFRTTPKISNSKKILFKIVDKIINGEGLVGVADEKNESLIKN